MSIGDRIRDARIAKGLTQEQLADLANVTKGAISNYESDVSSPRLDILYSLMRIFSVDANYMFQDNISHSSSYSLLPYEVEYIEKFRSADERAQSDALLLLSTHQKSNKATSDLYEDSLRSLSKAQQQNGSHNPEKEKIAP